MKVLILWYATEEEVAVVRDACPARTAIALPKGEPYSRFECVYDDVIEDARDADVMIGFTVPPGVVTKAENLKLISWGHSGLDELRLSGEWEILKERGVRVANIRGGNSIAVAEHGMMLMLASAKKILAKHQAVLEGRSLFPLYADEYRAAMLSGRTLGLIGLGEIGGRVARFAKAFDMNVLAVRKHPEKGGENVDQVYGMDQLHEMLGLSDYVMFCLPRTVETNRFFGRAEIEAMKPSAFLINVARGTLVNEMHLYEALKNNRIRGFATDNWWWWSNSMTAFPQTGGHLSRLNVQRLPNVVCTADQAGNADDVLERNIKYATRSVKEFFADKPITTECSLDLGY